MCAMLCFSLINENDRSRQYQAMELVLVYSPDDPVDSVDVLLMVQKCSLNVERKQRHVYC